MNRYIKEVGITTCKAGHTRLANQAVCGTCKAYRQTPWLRELDDEGETFCPRGHTVSHYTDSVVFYRDGKRSCKQCAQQSLSRALVDAEPVKKNETTCKKGIHPWPASAVVGKGGRMECRDCMNIRSRRTYWRSRTKAQRNQPLDPTWIDWVTVLRVLAGPLEPKAHSVKRGTTRGLTDGEKWVAYNSYKVQYGEPVFSGFLTGREDLFARWRDETAHYGWPVVTVWDILSELPSVRYRNNTYLKGGRRGTG